jgi:hypothetical protein
VLIELIEAASRAGKPEVAAAALERLTDRTRLGGTDWALGVEARLRALLEERAQAEDLYQEAVDRLGRTRILPSWAVRTSSTANGSGARSVVEMPGDSCVRPMSCSRRQEPAHSPIGHAASCWPPVRRCAPAGPKCGIS